MSSEKHTSLVLRIVIRIAVNIGIVVFLQRTFPVFFVLSGGMKAVAVVGLTLAALNVLVVPMLQLLALPIKFLAWIVGFVLVNVATLWLVEWFVAALAVEGITLTIGGGIVGWLTLAIILGVANWLVKAVFK